MKLIAETVIEDCRLATIQLDKAEKEENSHIIINWLTCLTLLRAVGHVLNKVDTPNFPTYKSIFESTYLDHKNDPIFTDFINKERNQILKEYTAYLENEVSIHNESVRIITEDGDLITTENEHNIIAEQTESIKRYFIKSDGFGKGLLLHQVVSKAISWWETYIAEIKIKIKYTT